MAAPRLDRLDKNFLINGDLRIWQRNTSALSQGEGFRTADRWSVGRVASPTMDAIASRNTDVPSVEFDYSMNIAVNTTQPSLSAGHRYGMFQTIEGLFAKPLYTKKALLNFWVKTNRPGLYGIWSGNSPATHSWNSAYTINAADTWEQKSILIDYTSKLGTWRTDNGIGSYIYFTLAGATTAASLDQWIAGAGFVPVGQENLFASAGGYWRVAGISLMILEEANEEFPVRDPATELILCQRYFQKSGNNPSSPWIPGVATNSGVDARFMVRTIGTTDRASFSENLPVQMRAAGVLNLYPARPALANNSGTISAYNGDTSHTFNQSALNLGPSGVHGYIQAILPNTGNELYSCQYTLDAEL